MFLLKSNPSRLNPYASWVTIRLSLKMLLHTTTKQLDSFLLFPTLPPEIRLQIWDSATHIYRLVRVEKYPGTYQSCIPSILHVNQESRAQGLRSYSLLFHRTPPTTRPGPTGRYGSRVQPTRQCHTSGNWKPRYVYFNHEFDTLLFDYWPRHKCEKHWLCSAEGFADIKRLAVSKLLWVTTNPWVIWRDLPTFRGVEEVLLVVDDCDGSKIQNVEKDELVDWNFDGRSVRLGAGELKVVFQRKIEKMVSARRAWRPDVRIVKFNDFN
jgi:hypothetical protein